MSNGYSIFVYIVLQFEPLASRTRLCQSHYHLHYIFALHLIPPAFYFYFFNNASTLHRLYRWANALGRHQPQAIFIRITHAFCIESFNIYIIQHHSRSRPGIIYVHSHLHSPHGILAFSQAFASALAFTLALHPALYPQQHLQSIPSIRDTPFQPRTRRPFRLATPWNIAFSRITPCGTSIFFVALRLCEAFLCSRF